MSVDLTGQWLVVVSGWTGAGKSTIATRLGTDLDATVASFAVVECTCSDVSVHRSRIDGRDRRIPGWHELDWTRVERGRQLYEPLPDPKVVIDAVESIDANLERVREHLVDLHRSTVG